MNVQIIVKLFYIWRLNCRRGCPWSASKTVLMHFVYFFFSRTALMKWSFGLPANIKQLPLPLSLQKLCFRTSNEQLENRQNNDNFNNKANEASLVGQSENSKVEVTWLYWLPFDKSSKLWKVFRHQVFIFQRLLTFTDIVWKLTCSMLPFVNYNPHTFNSSLEVDTAGRTDWSIFCLLV